MSKREFWRTTPKKLFGLLEVHNQLNNPDADDKGKTTKKTKKLTLEEALAWAGKPAS
jgi:hypothetical protein